MTLLSWKSAFRVYVAAAVLTWGHYVYTEPCGNFDGSSCMAFSVSLGYFAGLAWPMYWVFKARPDS